MIVLDRVHHHPVGQREHRERLVLADRLSVKEDPVVELLFRDVAPSLRVDTTIHRLVTSARPCPAGARVARW